MQYDDIIIESYTVRAERCFLIPKLSLPRLIITISIDIGKTSRVIITDLTLRAICYLSKTIIDHSYYEEQTSHMLPFIVYEKDKKKHQLPEKTAVK